MTISNEQHRLRIKELEELVLAEGTRLDKEIVTVSHQASVYPFEKLNQMVIDYNQQLNWIIKLYQEYKFKNYYEPVENRPLSIFAKIHRYVSSKFKKSSINLSWYDGENLPLYGDFEKCVSRLKYLKSITLRESCKK